MWAEVGNRVVKSDDGIGRVVQSAHSMFSLGQPGAFMLTSRSEIATVIGGPAKLLEIIEATGLKAEPAVVEAVEQFAKSGNISGNIEGVYRVGGRILIVAGLTADVFRIYQADDKIHETVKVVGGWSGATGAVIAYNSVMGPTNATGPVAWAVNIAGNISAGIGGYYFGEKIAEITYDLTVDPEPLEIPSE